MPREVSNCVQYDNRLHNSGKMTVHAEFYTEKDDIVSVTVECHSEDQVLRMIEKVDGELVQVYEMAVNDGDIVYNMDELYQLATK